MFSNLAPQKGHLTNSSLKKEIFQIALSKKIFFKLLPHKRHFQNCSLKNTFSKITFLRRTFSKNINLIALIYSSSESPEELS